MKTLPVITALFLALALSSQGEPFTVKELSFHVRAGDTDTFILGQLSERKLLRAPSAKQEDALKAQGASEALLRAVRDPKYRVPEADAIAFEKELEEREADKELPQIAVGPAEPQALITPVVKQVQPLTPVFLPLNTALVAPANIDDAGANTGTDLIIEKIIVQNPPPMPGPYYVWLQAQTGRAAVTFNIPSKTYGSEIASSDVEIPLNLKIRNVRLHDWATVKIQFDNQERAVRSIAPMKRATSRIEITTDPSKQVFAGEGDESDNFFYTLVWHAEER